MGEHATYRIETADVVRKLFKPELVTHIKFDKEVDDKFDKLLELSVTHDGSKENEGHVTARLLFPVVNKSKGEKFGVPVRLIWTLGTLTITEKRGKVQAAGRLIDGVAQHYCLPVRLKFEEI